MAETRFVVAPESERLLCGERKTAEYVVADPLNIEVSLKSGEVCRPQEIRERITRCRDCEHYFEGDCLLLHVAMPDMDGGFCSWGEPRKGDS